MEQKRGAGIQRFEKDGGGGASWVKEGAGTPLRTMAEKGALGSNRLIWIDQWKGSH